MKDAIKMCCLFLMGLLTVGIGYPVLHEMGHIIAAFFTGTKVLEVQLFPMPYVLCDIEVSNSKSIICVGFGGIVFPFLVTLFREPVRFWFWYVWFVLRGICILSFVISIVALVGYQLGEPLIYEDITLIMECIPKYSFFYYIVLFLLSVFGSIRIIQTHPLVRCLSIFEKK